MNGRNDFATLSRRRAGLLLVCWPCLFALLALPTVADAQEKEAALLVSGMKAAVNAETAPFYVSGERFADLPRDTRTEVLEVRGNWVGVQLTWKEKLEAGWIHKRFLRPATPTAAQIAKAKAALTRVGASIETDAEGNILQIDASKSKITDKDLALVGLLTTLETLYLDDTAITDAGLAHLKDLDRIESLALIGTKIDGSGLAHLRGLGNLRVLNLSRSGVTDKALANLSSIESLETVALTDTKITSAGLAHLKDLKNLITLNLQECAVDDDGLLYLTGLTKLRLLHLQDTDVTDEGVETLEDEVSGLAIYH